MKRYLAALYRRAMLGDGSDLNVLAALWSVLIERRLSGTLTPKDEEFLRGMDAIAEKHQAQVELLMSPEAGEYYKDPSTEDLIEFVRQNVIDVESQKLLINEIVGSN
jgi:hypothetical protein